MFLYVHTKRLNALFLYIINFNEVITDLDHEAVNILVNYIKSDRYLLIMNDNHSKILLHIIHINIQGILKSV